MQSATVNASPSTEGRSRERSERGWGAAPAPTIRQSWSRAALEVPPGAIRRPGLVPCALIRSPGSRQAGRQGRKDAAVERRYGEAGPQSRSRAPCKGTVLYAPNGAPLPLLREQSKDKPELARISAARTATLGRIRCLCLGVTKTTATRLWQPPKQVTH